MDTVTTRYDLYGPIHKGLRLGLSRLLVRLGCADWQDGCILAELMGDLRRQLALSALHLDDEDRFIRPELAARAPHLLTEIETSHEHHRETFEELTALISGLEAARTGERDAAGRRLYLAFSRFVADDLSHMHHEETVVQPALQAVFSDAELAAIEQRIVSSLAPPDFLDFMRLMLPAMTPAERSGLLSGVRQGAPPEVFDLIIEGAARPALDAPAWRRLAQDMQLAA